MNPYGNFPISKTLCLFEYPSGSEYKHKQRNLPQGNIISAIPQGIIITFVHLYFYVFIVHANMFYIIQIPLTDKRTFFQSIAIYSIIYTHSIVQKNILVFHLNKVIMVIYTKACVVCLAILLLWDCSNRISKTWEKRMNLVAILIRWYHSALICITVTIDATR